MRKFFIVSGANSGIGRAIAEDLAQKGHCVFATAPSSSALQSLVGISECIIPLILDIRSEEHISQLKSSVLEHTDHIDGLINNAGIGVGGPVELLDIDAIRNNFEINVFGHIRMTQTFLPLLRKAKGRIVFTGSLAGFFALPLQSAYASSKFAIRAFCDALRVELRPQNIRVSLIQPGSIKTPIWRSSPFDGLQEHPSYGQYNTAIEKAEKSLLDLEAKAAPVSIVTKAMNHALFSAFPKARYLVGYDAYLLFLLRIVPSFLMDRILIRFLL